MKIALKYFLERYVEWWDAIQQRIEVEQYSVAAFYLMFGIGVLGVALTLICLALASLPKWLLPIVLLAGVFYMVREGLKWEAKVRREWDDLLNNREKR